MFKKFLKSKPAKRFFWCQINMAMGLVISFITFAASENTAWAVSVLPLATGLSQMFTKYINTYHAVN